MAFPNVGDLIATTIERRSGKIADNVTANNSLYTWLNKKGNVEPYDGGRVIYEEIEYAANGNASFYSGADQLTLAAVQAFDAAEFAIKQAACPIVTTGLEELQNSGDAAIIDLAKRRIDNGEHSMANMMGASAFGSGTSYGGKEIAGLGLMVPVTTNSGTYGGINRATTGNEFWRSIASTGYSGTETSATIQGSMNALYAQLVRGSDKPDLGVADATTFAMYEASLQTLQRFTSSSEADLGFPNIMYKGAPVLLDSNCTSSTLFLLNSRFIHFRPHSKRNMVPLAKRHLSNQDVSVVILAWAGALTCSCPKLQGRLTIS